jgi:hypothetical protein
VEPEEMFFARLRLIEHVAAAKNTQATIEELLATVFSIGSASRLYNEDHRPAKLIIEER